MNNKLRDYFHSIDYDKYNGICKGLEVSGISSLVLNNILNSNDMVLGSCVTSLLTGVVSSLYMYMTFSDLKYNTKDVSEIRNLYKEFINNYNKLNKMFDFNNPLEIYAMYDYLLHNGYLSVNKNFMGGTDEVNDMIPLLGVNVISSKGVCRHISALLKDILNDYGIDSYNIGCFLKDYNLKCNILKDGKYSREELLKFIVNNFSSEKIVEYWISKISKLEEAGLFIEMFYEEKKVLPISKLIGNHAICLAFEDGKSYFLDACNSCVYRFREGNKRVLVDEHDGDIVLKLRALNVLQGRNNIGKVKKMLDEHKENISLEEEISFINSSLNVCKQNIDVFEKFYDYNKELYGEISNKLSKIKVKK